MPHDDSLDLRAKFFRWKGGRDTTRSSSMPGTVTAPWLCTPCRCGALCFPNVTYTPLRRADSRQLGLSVYANAWGLNETHVWQLLNAVTVILKHGCRVPIIWNSTTCSFPFLTCRRLFFAFLTFKPNHIQKRGTPNPINKNIFTASNEILAFERKQSR